MHRFVTTTTFLLSIYVLLITSPLPCAVAQQCYDDITWQRKGTGKRCSDVAESPKSRCKKWKDSDGIKARDACCQACIDYQPAPTSSPTLSTIDYATFTLPGDDPSTYNHNFPLPTGSKGENGGYNPIGQRDWGYLNKRGVEFEVFDWEEESKVEIRGNYCEDRNLVHVHNRRGRHKQSPIVLRDNGRFCYDEHKMHGNTSPGHNCSTNQVEFLTTKHNLRADFANCKQTPFIDITQSRHLWDLQFIEVVCPSNHVIEDPDTKELIQYPCEMILAHSGTENNQEEILQISVLLKGTRDTKRKKGRTYSTAQNEVEQLLEGWESHQKAQFDSCYMYWEGDNVCDVKNASRYEWPSESPSAAPTVTLSPSSGPTVTTTPSASPSDVHSTIPTVSSPGTPIHSAVNAAASSTGSTSNGILRRKVTQRDARDRNLQQTLPPTGDPWAGKKHYYLTVSGHNVNNSTNGHEYREEDQIKAYELFKDIPTDFYYRYQGSLTYPPCSDNVEWVVLRKPLKIANSQIHRLESLISKHIEINPKSKNSRGNYDECYFATVGRERNDGSCKVDVNRELQFTSEDHDLVSCTEWNDSDITREPTTAPKVIDNWDWLFHPTA